ncbi:MAG: DUF2332 family protein [Solirubrobacterales bacterium]|nr:DUF2332 family protein [Solirubrobacterales bacterium]
MRALLWPGEGNRLQLLRPALELARLDPPPLTQGDLRYNLAALASRAPSEATLVVFHTAVLAYLPDPADRTPGLADRRIARSAGFLAEVVGDWFVVRTGQQRRAQAHRL